MEIEVLSEERKENKKGKEERKEECVWGIKHISRDLGEILDEGYKLLASKLLSDEEKDQLVDIMASAKGGMKIIDKMLAEKSDIPEGTHAKINAKADEFLAGLEGKENSEESE